MIPASIRERSAFVDTSAFYALLDRSDRKHDDARREFERLAHERWRLFTSNLVVAETYALTLRRLGGEIARQWLASLDLELVFEDEGAHEDVRNLLDRYDEKAFSYADAASFVLMERLGIPAAFTFDADFQQYGIALLP